MKNAVVTGANRGIGRETVRQLAEQGYRVYLTGRDAEQVAAAAREVAAQTGGEVHGRVLDVSDTASAEAFGAALEDEVGAVHVLVNNAGHIFDDELGDGITGESEAVARSVDTNAIGALRVTRALQPLLTAEGANVVNVSSGMGGLTEMGGGYTGYRVSKAALNAITRILHADLERHGVRVNSVCPGWVATDMGGRNAPRHVSEGAASVMWAATLGEDGPSGGFFRDGNAIDW